VTTRAIVLSLALAALAAVASSQPSAGFKRTILQQMDISVPGREAVTGIAEAAPGASAGRHTHPGEEVGYVLEGTLLVEIEGKPAMTLNAGQTFLIPNGAVHNATNTGTGPARVLATYIVEKGKPLATPAGVK
jgi:quercetin dioxygenase-like cupin family protein